MRNYAQCREHNRIHLHVGEEYELPPSLPPLPPVQSGKETGNDDQTNVTEREWGHMFAWKTSGFDPTVPELKDLNFPIIVAVVGGIVAIISAICCNGVCMCILQKLNPTYKAKKQEQERKERKERKEKEKKEGLPKEIEKKLESVQEKDGDWLSFEPNMYNAFSASVMCRGHKFNFVRDKNCNSTLFVTNM